MNHYDDLQRFKDKTRNQALDFKDFSSQNQANDQGSWAILNQLLPASEENTFAAGGHVSLPVPQPVAAETFAFSETLAEPDTVNADVPLTSGSSILRGVAEQLSATVSVENVSPAPAAIRTVVAEPVRPQAEVNFSRLFAPSADTPKPAAEKNQPLNSLLERIATCR